ncbi:hypothetical protein [Archaeoglobus profundus]|uniref:Uncharacterized protein n=1 Tax=Archaeoglobus profundus (strain DSM 5631 / JCM 9629 / NBRC 100127 / Av18) TaxID=572546 RepID=D2RI47_ARCPA|nr:hypothetical protein [Archaeoglobus profundus]ADB57972.1 hypothetical protein Arcpr_0911 [Archaeoglobus profundus DSM 5631]
MIIVGEYCDLMELFVETANKRGVLQVLVSNMNIAQLLVRKAGERFATEDPELSKKLHEIADKMGDIISELVEVFRNSGSPRHSRDLNPGREEKGEEVKAVE